MTDFLKVTTVYGECYINIDHILSYANGYIVFSTGVHVEVKESIAAINQALSKMRIGFCIPVKENE